MKKLFLLLLCSPIIALNAQKIKISVDEKSEDIGGGNHNALVVIIYDATPDDIMSEWKSVMKGYNAKVSGKDELFADNAMIKDMSDNAVDVYAKAIKGDKDNETKFIVGFLLGVDWLTSSKHPDQYKVAEKIVKDFATKMTKDAIGDKVKAAQKKVDNLNDDQSSLQKKNKNLQDDIQSYQDKIKKAQDDLKANQDAQDKKKAEIDVAQKDLDAVKARLNSVE